VLNVGGQVGAWDGNLVRLKSKPVEAVREVHVTFFLGKPQIRRLAVSGNYIGGARSGATAGVH
jgi:hypothetical protein